ncbi:MAG: DegV family protein [Eubacterium sp.]
MVQIISDSSILYTREQAEKLGIEAIPLCVSCGCIEGRDMHVNMDDFYDEIKNGHHPKSSQPPIGDVLEAYEKYEDDDIVNISMADGLSGTYSSACMARDMAENKDRITVIDSKTLCGPHRYMVEKAQQMKLEGRNSKEIIEWINLATERHESFLISQDFNFLKRGGRLTPTAATLGTILNLKPILHQTSDGKRLEKFAVKRTIKAAIQTVIEHMKQKKIDTRHIIYISHARALKDAEYAKAEMEKHFKDAEVYMLELSAAFVTQGGPFCLAIQYIEK